VKDWYLVRGYNNQVLKRVNRFSKRMGCLSILIGIVYLVLCVLYIPLGIVDLMFFINVRSVRGVFGKGNDQYVHTFGSVTILILLFLFLAAICFYITNILKFVFLDWKINLAVAVFILFILSAATIQIMVIRSPRYRNIKLLNFAGKRFEVRITKIDKQVTKIKEMTGYTTEFKQKLDDNLNSLLSERHALSKEKKAIENNIKEISKSKIRLDLW